MREQFLDNVQDLDGEIQVKASEFDGLLFAEVSSGGLS